MPAQRSSSRLVLLVSDVFTRYLSGVRLKQPAPEILEIVHPDPDPATADGDEYVEGRSAVLIREVACARMQHSLICLPSDCWAPFWTSTCSFPPPPRHPCSTQEVVAAARHRPTRPSLSNPASSCTQAHPPCPTTTPAPAPVPGPGAGVAVACSPPTVRRACGLAAPTRREVCGPGPGRCPGPPWRRTGSAAPCPTPAPPRRKVGAGFTH